MYLFKKNPLFKLFIILIISISSGFTQNNTVGVILNDTTQSYNGYTLFAPAKSHYTYLIDNDGNLINKWTSNYLPALSAYLLENGHLLRAAKVEKTGQDLTGGFQKFTWNDSLVWEYYYGRQHHDVEPMPNGNVLLVVNDRKTKNAAIQAGRDTNLIDDNNVRSLSIIEVSQTGPDTGEIVWRWNAWDHLIQAFDNSKDNFGTVEDHPELIDINFVLDGDQNWLHTNSVSYDEELDQILVSNRRTHEIWAIDHSTTTEQAATHEDGNSSKGGDLLYRWGNPQAYGAGTEADQKLFGQHDAYRVKSGYPGEGNIVIFNNGWPDRGYSSIDEITPPVDQNGHYTLNDGMAYEPDNQSWIYTADPQTDFNSERYGGSQRLPNGNTLISNSVNGEFIEVTNAKEIVWKYINPVSVDSIINQGETNPDKFSVFRCYKYGPDYPGFDGKDLVAGDPVELAINDEQGIITGFELFDNYPNPFNPTTNIKFVISERKLVTVIIFDLLGNKVKTLVNQVIEPGVKTFVWNSLDNNGTLVSSGIYFYSVQAGDYSQTKKMILLR